MLKSKKSVLIFLTGGLGNQLFQLAAGLSLSHEDALFYESTLGRPRKNKQGEVQLECFSLPDNTRRLSIQTKSKFLSKVFGYVLRTGFNPRKIERIKLFESTTRLTAQLIFSIYSRRWSKLQVGKDVGFTSLDPKSMKSMLIGYFQSSRWIEDPYVFNVMSKLTARDFRDREIYLAKAQASSPIMLHVRLTDYIDEDNFGLLGKKYYEDALASIKFQRQSESNPQIWIFSDDIDAARKFLNFLDEDSVSWFNEIEYCPVKTLEVMRMCDAFIIGNSTFSWWAAALKYNQKAIVCYPDPWFKSVPTPFRLTPESWHPVNANWRQSNH